MVDVAPRMSTTYGPGGSSAGICAAARDPQSTAAQTTTIAAPRGTYFPAFAFRRSAQYLRIRSETALRASADIARRRRRPARLAALGAAPPFPPPPAAPRRPLPTGPGTRAGMGDLSFRSSPGPPPAP